MLKKVLIILAAVIGLLAITAYLLPREVAVERSIVIDAPPEVVYPLVANFSHFAKWSPWSQKDENAEYTFEGPAQGTGAKMSWTGNDQIGTGSQTILHAIENQKVVTALDFGEEGQAVATFTLTPVEGGTKVTWSFETDVGNNPIGRWFGLMFDSMIGGDYEEGLSNLKALAENPTPAG